ncbi:MAG: hypothetical protein ACLRSD_02155 [Oscillibacter sp.]
MSEFHYALGLDIGIGSVGWAVLRNQPNGEPDRIQDLGVRIFDKAEQPKTGASLAPPADGQEAPGAVCAAIGTAWNASVT